jgi:hypothetical protein
MPFHCFVAPGSTGSIFGRKFFCTCDCTVPLPTATPGLPPVYQTRMPLVPG